MQILHGNDCSDNLGLKLLSENPSMHLFLILIQEL